MSFLQENSPENLSARITDKGRKQIAAGNFNITYFQIGDSEFDYGFSMYTGLDGMPVQKVLSPMDKDSQIKYPYKITDSLVSGTTFGTPILSSITDTVTNNVGPAGFVSGWSTGSTIVCLYDQVDIGNLNGTNSISVTSGSLFTGSTYVTVAFGPLGTNGLITTEFSSLVYEITGITGNTIYLDRPTPDLSSLTGVNVAIICNDCNIPLIDSCLPNPPDDQQDAWTLETVWSQKPAGLEDVNEYLSGYTSDVFVSTKEYLGYNTSLGQITNSGTTIVNSFGDIIVIPPEEQHSLSILHYSKTGTTLNPDNIYKYDDYIAHTDPVDISYFEVYIPFMWYHRNTGTTIGARFFMDSTDYFINSTASDTKYNQILFRYLLDEQGNRVGKIFVNHQLIIFDDQEITASLDYKSNRRYTLPAPRIGLIPVDIQCGTGEVITPTVCSDPVILGIMCVGT